MNYSLGNMLSRGGALNPDGLSLDLAFATDKTLTARRGPTPTFTRASTATFVGSNGLIQSAAINAARFDHNPATLVSRGLLIEESRTNLYSRSEEFETATWTKTRSSITANATTAPDGTLTADKLVEDTSILNTHTINSSVTPPATSHTFSVFVKKAERNFIVLRLGGSNDFFNLDTGVAITNVNTPTITNFGNGWYRCTVTSAGGTQGSLQMSADGITTLYTGDGASGVFIWGAQLEAGSFPTSYIPTTTAALTRSADVCSITGGDFTSLYNATEGTILANASTPASGDRTVLSTDDNTANEMTRLRTEGTNPFFKVTDGGSDVVAIDAGTVTANTTFKLAAAYEINNFAASINGGTVVADTSGTIPTVDRMRIGAGQGGNTMCGHIARIQYFRKRLPDAKLQSLTT